MRLDVVMRAMPPNIIIRLHSVQAVVVWVAQPWLPTQPSQVVDQMRRAKRGDSATRANRSAQAWARGGTVGAGQPLPLPSLKAILFSLGGVVMGSSPE